MISMDTNEYEKFISAMDAAQIAWWEMILHPGHEDHGQVRFGDTKATMLGYEPSQFKHYTDFTELVDPADFEPMMEDMRKHMRGEKEVYETMYRIQCADGTYKQFYDRGKIVQRDGDRLTLRGFVINVNNIQQYAYSVTAKFVSDHGTQAS